MSIQALPASTVQLLGSSTNIVSPCDLVKELIENAVDAKATAIEITISSNTIDRVTVKDNGTGIDIDDFNSLGRRAHTSKLRAFEELTTLGGRSLGFRGEALASANALSNIIIITKKLGNPVAWRIELEHAVGGVKAKQPVSATVGTTVAATRLFENMPPRKQYILKEKNRTMLKIQNTVKAYALARPHIKWSLKMVGNTKPMWSYSPARAALGREAILQSFGSNILRSCTEINEEITQRCNLNMGNSSKSSAWIFTGYVGAQHSTHFNSQAVFISIDGRPMSSSWHISKAFASILKSYIISTEKQSKTSPFKGHLFAQLNVQCPPRSYDPNITAQKDEVLFADEKFLLEKLDLICRNRLNHDLQCHPTVAPLTDAPLTDPGRDTSATGKKQPLHEVEVEVKGDPSPPCENKNNEAEGQNLVGQEKHHHVDLSATKRPTIKTVLKTSFTVNMSNREDDQSDDEDVLEAIEVEIPRRPTPVQAGDQSRKDNIRHYFHPVPTQDFDIACDSTAATTDTLEAKEERQLADPHSAGRTRLRPLTASDLNRMRDEAESSPEQPGSTSAIPHIERPESSWSSSIAAAPSPGFNNVIRREPWIGGLGRSSQQLTAPTRSIRVNQEAAVDLPFVGHSQLILTPPPSDPRYRLYPEGLPLGSRLRSLDASPTRTSMTNRFNDHRTALANVASSSKRSGGLLSGDTGYNGHQDTFAAGRLRRNGSGPSARGKGRERITHVAEKPCYKVATRNMALLGRPTEKTMAPFQPLSFSESLPESTSMLAKKVAQESPCAPVGYSHALQINLARTPAPMSRFDANTGNTWTRELEDTELKGTKSQSRIADAASPIGLPEADGCCSSSLVSFDKQSSPERNGISRSEVSGRLLFQSQGMANTHCLCTTIECGHGDIERLVRQHAKVDQYELPGDIAVTLLSANLGGVQSVQKRLQLCVDSWMQQNKMRIQVDYMM